MRRWLIPLVLLIVSALVGWRVALVYTPDALMRLAERRVATLGGGVNHMSHGPLVTAAARAIVRPSPDLLYSSCPFSLSGGPVLVEVPAIAAPYWSLSVFDGRTNVAFVRNNGETPGGLRIAIVQPGQSAPAGYRPVAVPLAHGIALVRVLIDRTKPIDTIDAQRRRASCRPA